MTFPSNTLEAVLQSAAAGATGMHAFLESLANSTVFVATSQRDDGGMMLPTMTIDNRAYVRVYTSEEQAQSGGEPDTIERVPAQALIRTLPRHLGFAVNPGGDLGLPIFAETLQQLVSDEVTISTGSRILIGDPAEEPASLLAALATAFAALPAVRSARRCWAAVNDEPPGLVIGVDVDPDLPDTRQRVRSAVRACVAREHPASTVDLVFTSDRDDFTVWMQQHAEAFYAS